MFISCRTWKRYLALLLAMMGFIMALFGCAAAEESTPAEHFTTSVLNGTYCSITGYTGDAAEIVIPGETDGYIVQSISDNAFKGNTAITSVTLPDTIESVGANAFQNCTSLVTFNGGSGYTTFGNYMLAGCTSLTDVTMSDMVTSIGSYAFSGCTALEQIALNSVTSIGDRAFINCTALKDISFGDELNVIYSYAFENCISLTEIHLPDSITQLASCIFQGCTNLTAANHPKNWTTVLSQYNNTSYSAGDSRYQSPFHGSALAEIAVPEGASAVPAHAYRGVSSLKKITLADSVQSIGAYAIDTTGVEEIDLGGVKTLGNYALYNNKSLKALTLPDTLESMGSYALAYNTGLTEIAVPEALRAWAIMRCRTARG